MNEYNSQPKSCYKKPISIILIPLVGVVVVAIGTVFVLHTTQMVRQADVDTQVDTSLEGFVFQANELRNQRKFDEAILTYEKALEVAKSENKTDIQSTIQYEIEAAQLEAQASKQTDPVAPSKPEAPYIKTKDGVTNTSLGEFYQGQGTAPQI